MLMRCDCCPTIRRGCAYSLSRSLALSFFFFNAPATTEIYTLSLHDALPISLRCSRLSARNSSAYCERSMESAEDALDGDRKSTRLNSSDVAISYAVFCLKKKKRKKKAKYTT